MFWILPITYTFHELFHASLSVLFDIVNPLLKHSSGVGPAMQYKQTQHRNNSFAYCDDRFQTIISCLIILQYHSIIRITLFRYSENWWRMLLVNIHCQDHKKYLRMPTYRYYLVVMHFIFPLTLKWNINIFLASICLFTVMTTTSQNIEVFLYRAWLNWLNRPR